ncbi:uncharacterized protein LOC126783260 [Argentina anserina]|uniref:uncharacterized protein LOC126783260 n=1 Tax=Argentina anserina TaxID=57926 RepID=UPI002176282A|nr:uncharacterized protein LOC126783260 [Potentilla anserina]
MATSEPSNTDDDLSAAATTITFDHPIPLLRGPVRAAPPDDPPSGPYVLAFRNPKAWASAYRASESKIIHQCEGGSRIGCAISAASKCKPPWWRFLIGGRAPDLKERAECEERETEACLAAAKDKCAGFARDKCVGPFREARVCGRVSKKHAGEMVGWASLAGRSRWLDLIGLESVGFGVTNCRAGELVGYSGEVDRILRSDSL